MITPSGQAKVLDFGLAKVTTEVPKGHDEGAAADEPHPLQTNVDGIRLGTLPYMSPEQVRGERLDARTDVFSLGAVLFEMVTGRRPFEGNADADVATAILSATPPSVTVLIPAAPAALDQITRRGLERDPDRRYQTMSELAADLEDLRLGLGLRSRSAGRVSARAWVAASALVLIVVGLFAGSLWSTRQHLAVNSIGPLKYVQLTNFPDSVHSPVLSPDGTMLAFLRGAGPFEFPGSGSELYVKALPDGPPLRLTDDGHKKAAPTFTPDGSHIVFTDTRAAWSSFSVPTAGGPPALFMQNASGLRWVAAGQLLFSEMKKAPNMAIVTATANRAQSRDVYVPASAGMAHFSERSPDGREVLVVEMENAILLPCRLVPFDGSSPGRQVGPLRGECTSATWSPDGQWMYFAAIVDGESHLWRQRFPDGLPEQVTFGPNQERDVVMDGDGKSVIMSVGAMQSTVWYHDEHGDRPVSAEGYAYRPLLSADGRKVFYLLRRATKPSFSVGELWAVELATGRHERVLPGFLVRSYHLSRDEKDIVFDAFDETNRLRVWIAATDRRQAPRQLTRGENVEQQRPFFGASGDVYFMEQSQGRASLARMKPDGSARRQLAEDIDFLVNISPDEKWAVLWHSGRGASLLPLEGGAVRRLCACGLGPIYSDSPSVGWSGDGTTMHVNAGKRTLFIPWWGADTFTLAASAIPSPNDLRALPGAWDIPESSIAPGRTAATYAFTRQAEQSNLYQIRLP